MVEDKIVNEIKDGIYNMEYHEHTRVTIPEKYYLNKFFTNIENNDKRLHRYITEIVETQGRYLLKAIENKKSVTIPNLGKFSYNYVKSSKNSILSSFTDELSDLEKKEILVSKLRNLKINMDKKKIHNNMLNCIKRDILNKKI